MDQHENLDPIATTLSTGAGTEQQSVYYDANGNHNIKTSKQQENNNGCSNSNTKDEDIFQTFIQQSQRPN